MDVPKIIKIESPEQLAKITHRVYQGFDQFIWDIQGEINVVDAYTSTTGLYDLIANIIYDARESADVPGLIYDVEVPYKGICFNEGNYEPKTIQLLIEQDRVNLYREYLNALILRKEDNYEGDGRTR